MSMGWEQQWGKLRSNTGWAAAKGTSWQRPKCKHFTFTRHFVVQLLSPVWLFATPWTVAYQTSLSFTISRSLLKFTSIELVMPSSHPFFCFPLLLPPSIFTSIGVFSNESALHIRWPKYWSFSFRISPSDKYSGLIFFAVQGTLKSLHQTHKWKPQFSSSQPSLRSKSHIHTWLLGKL